MHERNCQKGGKARKPPQFHFDNCQRSLRIKMKIAYVTDSGTGRSIEEMAKDGIISIPLQITDGISTYQDMETFTYDKCVDELKSKKVLMTSQPSPGLVEECFTSLKEQGVELIIAVPICNGLSSTASTMTAIANSLDMRIITVDTYATGELEYYLINRLKKAYEEGKSDLEVKLLFDEVINSADTLVLPDDLSHLARGGRLTPLASKMAKLLRISPVLHLCKETGGHIDMLEKVRTKRKALAYAVEHMKKSDIDENWIIHIFHTDDLESAEKFKEQVQEEFPNTTIEIHKQINPVSAQAGLKTICVQYFKQV